MSAVPASAPATPVAQPKLRIMVVDDSVVIRGMIARWIEAETDLAVIASLRTGREAVARVAEADPDVVILDIEMPDLDGLSALPLLLAKKRDLVVIMASTLTRRNAEISLKALSLGAADYVPKPESTREKDAAEIFRRDLIEKVRQLGMRKLRRAGHPAAPARPGPAAMASARTVRATPALALRPWTSDRPKALLVGSSTGGPQALMAMLTALAPDITDFPVLVTQHMPPTFTTILAEHLARATGRPAHEAQDGETVRPGTIYVAPGGRHMRVARQGAGPVAIMLGDDAPVNFCKPAVDPLFASAAEAWGRGALAVVLTGMGHDGTKGGEAIVVAGGNVIAQDEATSVVWGMPGSAAHAGICAAVLPLGEIAPELTRRFHGDRK